MLVPLWNYNPLQSCVEPQPTCDNIRSGRMLRSAWQAHARICQLFGLVAPVYRNSLQVITALCNVSRRRQHFLLPSLDAWKDYRVVCGVKCQQDDGIFCVCIHGRNSSKFSESENDFSAVDEYILPSDGQQKCSDESALEDKLWGSYRPAVQILVSSQESASSATTQCASTVESLTNKYIISKTSLSLCLFTRACMASKCAKWFPAGMTTNWVIAWPQKVNIM